MDSLTEPVDFGIRFARASQALRWAEEFATRPSLPNWHRLIGMPRGSIASCGPSYNDLLDLAHTITLAARSVSRPDGAVAYLFAHLSGPAVQELLNRVVFALWERITEHPRASRLSARQRLALAIVCARAFRVLQQNGKPLPKAEYARALHLSRSALYDGPWPELLTYASVVLSQWYEQGHWALAGKLEEIGVLS